jgi:uncharacterized protein involved in type VI secretion and phage assembly
LEDAFGKTLDGYAQAWLSKTISFRITSADKSAGDSGEVQFIGVVSSADFISSVESLGMIRVMGFSPTIMMDIHRMYRIWPDVSSHDIINNLISAEGLPNASVKASNNAKFPGLLAYGETPFEIINYLAGFEGWWAYYDGLNFNVVAELPEDKLELKDNCLGSFSVLLDSSRIKSFKGRAFEFIKGNWFQAQSTGPGSSGLALAKAAGSAKGISGTQENVAVAHKPVSQGDLDQRLQAALKATHSRLLRSRGTTDRLGVIPGKTLDIQWTSKPRQTESRGEESFSGLYLVTRVQHNYKDGQYGCEFNCVARDLAFPYYAAHNLPEHILEVGEVTSVDDAESLGQVKVRFGWDAGTDTESPFIRVCQQQAGATPHGNWIIPEVSDSVLVSIRGRHLENAMVIGSLYDGSRKPRNDLPTQDNMTKSILTKSGNEITLKDDQGKEQILVKTKGDSCSVILDASSGKENISISVKNKAASIVLDGTGKVVMDTQSGACKISMDGQGQAIKIESQGSIALKANDVTIEGTAALNLKSSAQIKEEAGAGIDINGGAMVNVKGGIIKLN